MQTSHAAIAASLLLAAAGSSYPAFAASTGSWQVRAGVSDIEPKSGASSTAAGDINVDNQFGPSVNLTYFFTPQIAIDVLGALPFKHDINIDGNKAASTKHLPPVVSLQYHFLTDSPLQPYLGVGLNYTWFFDEHLNGSSANLQIKNSFGVAAQAGLDWKFDEHWLAGVDLRWVDIDADTSVNGTPIGTVHVDPLVYSATLGYRF